ncbi:hypothetical protein DFH06DRAFT_1471566 [Mycena polygramma]|nr:hypothetical protein DFH06DRAFT_1471566 [Mycena polygramma]
MDSDMDNAAARGAKRVRRDSYSPPPSAPPTRDAQFYHTSGDCIIRVENTLFKIHKYLLVRDSLVFSDLFGLPQGDGAVEGMSDALPICFSDDREDHFRALLRYIYAPAFDTQASRIPLSDLNDVLAAGRIAHKYQMETWRNWALLVLNHVCENTWSLSSYDHLAIYSFASAVSAPSLRKVVMDRWSRRVEVGALPICVALDAAEAHSDRDFLTSLYVFQLSQLPMTTTTDFQATKLAMPDIAPAHIQRLLAGYWSLSLSWAQFRGNIPDLPRIPICSRANHASICIMQLKVLWTSATAEAEKHCIVDLTSRVQTVIDAVSSRAHNGRCLRDSEARLRQHLLQQQAEVPKQLKAHFFVTDAAST